MFSGQELVDSLETLRPDVLITDITRRKFPKQDTSLVRPSRYLWFVGKGREQCHEFELLGKPMHLPDFWRSYELAPERIRLIEHVGPI
jgi:hypothetical protein